MELFLNLFEYPNNIMYNIILKTINNDFICKISNQLHVNPISLYVYLNHNYNKINNVFLSNEHKLFFKNYFSFVGQKLFLIYRIIFKWKLFIKNKNNTIINYKDLYLDDINIDNSVSVYQNKKIYLFSINDIIHIFENALLNHNYEHPNPIQLKNPYTNCKFDIPTLYNIYYQLSKKTNINKLEYIRLFMINDFNLDLYLENNYDILLKNSYLIFIIKYQ